LLNRTEPVQAHAGTEIGENNKKEEVVRGRNGNAGGE